MADNEITATEKAVAKKKEPKKYGRKKLPRLFRKAYSQRRFDAMLKRVFVDEDKALLVSLFEKTVIKGKERLVVPMTVAFTKKERVRLKAMAKAIKANRKARFRLIPFVAVAVFVAAVGIAVTTWKNQIVRRVITSAMEGAFGAKCDIGAVNVEIFGARLNVRSLAQANKDEPMKNVFQFDNLDLNFNLTQLLRGRFDAENIEITGVALGTDRKTSGALPKKEREQKAEEQQDETGFYASLKEKGGAAAENAKESLTNAFAAYNPQNVAADIKENFKSAEKAKEVESEVRGMVEAWKEKPAQLQKEVADFQATAQGLASINVNALNTAAGIQDAITKITAAIETGKRVKTDVVDITDSIKSDAEKVRTLSGELADAIASDKDLITSKLGMYTDVGAAKGILTDTLDSVAYEMLGKYYPYLQKAISYAGTMKAASGEKASVPKEKKAKKKKTGTGRLYGRDVYWRADRVPTFLVERLAASGRGDAFSFEATVTDISSDMDKRGAPIVAKGSYTNARQTHVAGLTVDARTASTAPLITGSYTGNNYPIAFDLTKTVSAPGVPQLAATAGIAATLTADADFSFGISGSLDMDDVRLTAAAIPYETVNRLYQDALATIQDLSLGANIGFSQAHGIDLSITTDLDKKLMGAMQSMAGAAVREASAAAVAKAQAELDAATGGAASQILAFTGITDAINTSGDRVNSLNELLEAKKKELTDALAAAGKAAVEEAASNATKNLLQNILKK